MASNGQQPGYEDAPGYPEEDALASGADLEENARFAVWRGNHLKGTSTQRLAWSAEYPTIAGVYWSDLTNGHLYRSDGSGGWADLGDPAGHPYAVAQGSFVTASSIAVNGNLTTTITFPAGRFSVAPFVFVVCQNGRVTGGSEDRTTTGCKVSLSNWSDASMGAGQVVMWQAVQMAPGSAAG